MLLHDEAAEAEGRTTPSNVALLYLKGHTIKYRVALLMILMKLRLSSDSFGLVTPVLDPFLH